MGLVFVKARQYGRIGLRMPSEPMFVRVSALSQG